MLTQGKCLLMRQKRMINISKIIFKKNEKDSKQKYNDNNILKDKIVSEEINGKEKYKIDKEEKNKINDNDNDNDSDEFIIRYGTSNMITLIYYAKTKGVYKILGETFVAWNKDNIIIVINYKDSPFVHECELQEGDNRISLIIKNSLTNITEMFHECNSLKDISDLRYLDVSKVKYFDLAFAYIETLSDISPLSN